MSYQINWNDYFMAIAKTVSIKSKDPKTKVGCVIVNQDNHIIATGYNGCPPGFPETYGMWNSDEKHDYVIHAEMNALLHSTQSVQGCVLYTTMYPCKECAKSICSAGILKVFYSDLKYFNPISEKLFRCAGIQCTYLTQERRENTDENRKQNLINY